VLPSLFALSCTAAAVVALDSLAESAESVLSHADDLDMVAVTERVMTEAPSSLTHEDLGQLAVAPGIARAGGSAKISPEVLAALYLNEAGTGIPKVVTIRGVDPVALQVHSRVRLVAGRFPGTGEPGVIIGRALAGHFVDLNEGGALHLGRHDWPVLGVFESDDALESEIWAERSAVMDGLHHPAVSVAYERLESAQQRREFVGFVKRIKGLEAITVGELMRRRMNSSGMSAHTQVLRTLCALLALGAIFACMNLFHGSFQSRLPELATLMALGFTRGRVFSLALQEGAIVAGCATVVGLPLSLLIDGRTWVFRQSLFYTVRVGLVPALVGLATIAVIATAGALLAAVQVRRMDILSTLRGG
jgi:putative ABC transport system permease protein